MLTPLHDPKLRIAGTAPKYGVRASATLSVLTVRNDQLRLQLHNNFNHFRKCCSARSEVELKLGDHISLLPQERKVGTQKTI
jgi:hypothetical protein